MITLADLIAGRKGDDSYETLAERGGLSTSAVHKFATGQNRDFPPPETVLGLARALQVTPREVVIAAAYGLGIDMAEPDSSAWPAFGRLLPPEVDQLPEHARRSLLDHARSMVALTNGDAGAGNTGTRRTDPATTAKRAAARRSAAVAELSDARSRRRKST